MNRKLRELTESAKKKLYVGIGNVLKHDDGAGVYVAKNIERRYDTDVLVVEVSIENYIGKINALNADVLILIDCMDLERNPGDFELVKPEDIKDFTTNTHNVSLKKLKTLFTIDEIYVLGIQPKNVQFGEGLSTEVMKAAQNILRGING